MEELKLYTLEEVENEIIGPVGTPERDQYEMDLENELYAYKLGETNRRQDESLPTTDKSE